MANGVSVDMNCELADSSVSVTGVTRMLTPDADYRTYEARNTASCRNTLPGSSGNSPVESRSEYQSVPVTGGAHGQQGAYETVSSNRSVWVQKKKMFNCML